MAWLEERHPQNENFIGICFTDAKKEYCNSTYETNLPNDYCQLSKASDIEKAGVQKPYRNSCDSYSSTDLDLECGSLDDTVIVDKSEKDCRICSINLKTYRQELGIPIVLGCSCNGDLAFAHQKCAEKWFKIKGNMICEICGSMVKNFVGLEDTDSSTWNSIKSSNNAAATTETQSFFLGYRLITCIISGMGLATVLCWFIGFHTR